MSSLRLSNGDDYPDASKKHIEDSEVLFIAARYDGAGYLAGYAIECILKAIILVEKGNSVRHHDLNKISTNLKFILATPSSKTAKYIKNPNITKMKYGKSVSEWEETIRYQSQGRVNNTDASDWIKEAKRLYQEVIYQIILDGVIS